MAEMPIEPRLAKCLLASFNSDSNSNDSRDNIHTVSEESSNAVSSRDSGRGSGSHVKANKASLGCTEELLSIAAMCSVDYPFISFKAKVSDERKQQRLGEGRMSFPAIPLC